MNGPNDIASTVTALPITGVVVLVLLSLLPLALLSMTSFLKVSVVLNILRTALGAQGIPSVALTGLLAMILTAHIMRPVGEEMLRAVERHEPRPAAPPRERVNLTTVADLVRVAVVASAPLERFLRAQSGLRERRYFLALGTDAAKTGLAERSDIVNDGGVVTHVGAVKSTEPLPGESFLSLVPAFVFSELRAACAIGVRIYLPFLVIDLVIASLLVGVGMSMVSPVPVALPLKLLLFVTVDGWLLLAEGLVQSYAVAV